MTKLSKNQKTLDQKYCFEPNIRFILHLVNFKVLINITMKKYFKKHFCQKLTKKYEYDRCIARVRLMYVCML